MVKLTAKEWQSRIDNAIGKNKCKVLRLREDIGKGKADLVCSKHGKFVGSPRIAAAGGNTCQKCRHEQTNKTKHRNSIQKIERVISERFEGRLEYLDGFVSTKDLARFKCIKHGEFQTYPEYLFDYKHPCPKCANEVKGADQREDARLRFIDETKKHKVTFKFSKSYKDSFSPVRVLCLKHKVKFSVVPNSFLSKSRDNTWKGCPSCVSEWRRTALLKSDAEFKAELRSKNNSVRLVGSYKGSTAKNHFRCSECNHHWEATADSVSRTKNSGCPRCSARISAGEQELYDFVKAICPDAVQSVREVFSHRMGHIFEWDIFIPSKNIAIEYNGLYFHRYPVKPKWYHQEKTRCSADAGVRLIHVYEDDWNLRNEVVCKTLKFILGGNKDREFARKLTVASKMSLTETCAKFYEKNHMLGSPNNGITYALLDGNRIKALMTFSKVVSNRGKLHTNDFELARFASSGQVIGGASRLFSSFLRDFNPSSVVSYSDTDMFDGKVYEVLGFTKVATLSPDYRTVWKGRRRHKSFTRRRNLERLLGDKFDERKSEMQNLIDNGILVLFDSGKVRWEWHK